MGSLDFISENITFTSNEFENGLNKNKTLSIIKAFSQTWDEDLKKSQNNLCITKKSHISSQHINSDVKKESYLENIKIDFDVDSKNDENGVRYSSSSLNAWGLPKSITDKYESKGVVEMFPWQVQCLSNSRILMDYGNLVYSAPTSAGKTLVAEILAIKNILERRKKVIIILPFVSVVREKMFYFQDIFGETGVRVEGFMGSHTPPGGFQSINIAICTIEKANSLVNKLLEENSISELGAVIVDELHLIGDPHRGYILELLLTKLLYISKKCENVQIQIVGMSATLPNLDSLSRWLNAELYKTDFRPIPLQECCLMSDTVYNTKFEKIRRIVHSDDLPNDKESIIHLCLETIIENRSVLIFCPTKNWCENLAKQIATTFKNLGYSNSELGTHLRKQLKSDLIEEVLEQLKCSPVGLDEILSSTISFGVAFHHAGLTLDERDILECAFKKNAIRVLIATSTLSSGVNLPARRVIIRSPVFCGKPINIMTYKQMVGRAGRMGIDSSGESILICSQNEKKIALNLMTKEFDPISSCLEGEDKLMRAVLEAIASNIALTRSNVELFINCTLLLSNMAGDSEIKYGNKILEILEEYELIRFSKDDDIIYYSATPLGKACLSSSMSPQDGLMLFIELQKARESFVLETDLHMIYLVTPYSICSQWGDINWFHFLNLWDNLSAAMKRVGKLVGIQESFIHKCLRGSGKNHSMIPKKYQIYKRFYTALALQELVNEIPLNIVADKFNCSRGVLQSLQQSAATFAGMVTAFSQKLGWKSFEVLVSQFQDRLHFGIQSELLDLMKLQSLNALRARAIFNMGIETIAQLATADIFTVENALNSAIPFESDKIREGEDLFDVNQRNNLKRIWITGKEGVTAKEAAELLITEARMYVQNEIGMTEIKWNSQPNSKTLDKKSDLTNYSHVQEYDITSTVRVNTIVNNSQNISNIRNHEAKISCTLSPKIVEPESPQHSTPIRLERINSIHIELNNQSALSCLDESLFSINGSNISFDFKKKSDHNNVSNIQNNSLNKRSGRKSIENNINENISNNILNIDISKTVSSSIKNNSINISDLSKSLSLFEDSFTIDTQLCHILDSRKSSLKEYDFKNNKMQVKQLEKKTKSDEKILSVSFEINNLSIDTERKIIISSPRNVKPDSQIVIESNIQTSRSEKCPDANHKKRKLSENSFTIDSSIPETQKSIITMSPFKQRKLSKKSPVKIFQSESFTLLNTSIIDVSPAFTTETNDSGLGFIKYLHCNNIQTFNEISQHILFAKKFSIFVNYEESKATRNDQQIGYNFLNFGKLNFSTTNNVEKRFTVKGMSIFIDEFGALYIDLSSDQMDKKYIDTVLITLKKILTNENYCVTIYDCKKIFSVMYNCFGFMISCQWEDPLIADWLLDSDSPFKPLIKMANIYGSYDLERLFDLYEKENEPVSKIVSIKAWASWCIMKSVKQTFVSRQKNLFQIFDKEMEALQVLSNCEISGISVDKDIATAVKNRLKLFQSALEQNAFKITGRRFNFASSTDVAKALRIYKGRKVSTSKRILEKVENPLAQIIIYWRKLNTILTKNLFPLISAISKNNSGRIYESYWTHTSTGRISVQELNLQSMPRNFVIPPELFTKDQWEKSLVNMKTSRISCRDIFSNLDKTEFMSADYCQLELRLLTHMCKDVTLLKIVNSDIDMFTAIASSWKNVPQEEVDDELRQRTKQMCYGIIYGMGIKALAECLCVCETDASVFMSTFHSAYPGIKTFINLTIESCRRLGYVETLTGRRRYLPAINSANYSEKSHAERQAVNTAIQGSASDILKSAMISVHRKIMDSHIDLTDVKLVLLLHDELMYEVPKNKTNIFHYLLKGAMENTIKLSVPLPVKIKVGKSWGKMTEYAK